jgi:hypothetical protein
MLSTIASPVALAFVFLISITYVIAHERDRWQETVFSNPYLIEAYAYTQKLMGKREIYNFGYIISDSGAVRQGQFYSTQPHPNELRQYAYRIHRLNLAVENQGGRLIFMGTPDTITEGDGNIFASGMYPRRFSNDMDTFFNYMRELRVDYLDVRNILNQSHLPSARFMFNTDHNWTTEASFKAFRGLAERLSLDPEYFYRDISNYDLETHRGIFLGSYGRATGSIFSGFDDFTVFFPRFDNEYHIVLIDPISGEQYEIIGEFRDTLCYEGALNITDPYTQSPYDCFVHGMNSHAKITNLDNPDAPKLLLIHDSFMQPMVGFLAPLFSEIHMIWAVYDVYKNNMPFDVEKYISENSFDYVIVQLHPLNITDSGVNFFR